MKGGKVSYARSASPCRVVSMDLVQKMPSNVSARRDGQALSVTALFANKVREIIALNMLAVHQSVQ